jgi:PrtD family type I secretion system ABC transporter
MRWLLSKRLRSYAVLAGAASLILNLALLIPSIYMLQVFDRVFSSRSEETLVMLSLLALVALVLGYFVDSVRAEALGCAGRALDRHLSPRALAGTLQHAAVYAGTGNTDVLRDISALRNFLASGGMLAIFDAPWVPIYLLVITLMHPLLGLTATMGAALLLALAAATEMLTRGHTENAQQKGRSASEYAQALTRNAEVIVGMGMLRQAVDAWTERHEELLSAQEGAKHRSVRLSAAARMTRQALQIAMLALGAWLVLDEKASPGIMVAATILLGRALQPVEQLIGGWKATIEARTAWERLCRRVVRDSTTTVELPAPKGKLDVEGVVHTLVPGRAPFIRGISLRLTPGESLGIIGPSASGKTTLLRLMLGILEPQSGVVRLDGTDISRWNRNELGGHIGYLPQDVELFTGSVAQNIARLGAVDSSAVIEAAQLAGVHELIVRLPEGYETQIGHGGAILSGGQRQRVGLARALYGDPRLIVLDEPNANLDAEGEIALSNALKGLKQRGVTLVVVAHRSNLLSQLDKLAVLRDGCLEAFDRTDVVLSRLEANVRPLHRLAASRIGVVEMQR